MPPASASVRPPLPSNRGAPEPSAPKNLLPRCPSPFAARSRFTSRPSSISQTIPSAPLSKFTSKAPGSPLREPRCSQATLFPRSPAASPRPLPRRPPAPAARSAIRPRHLYISDPDERNRFRGVSAHNTLRIDGRDQAIHRWSTSLDEDLLDATCAYAGFLHRRRILFAKPALLIVCDSVDGPPGDHTLEQFWHLESLADAARFSFSASAAAIESWRSRALCVKEPSPALSVAVRGPLPLHIAAVIDFSDHPVSTPVEVHVEGSRIALARTPLFAGDPLPALSRRLTQTASA